MRHKGNTSDYLPTRNELLLKRYKQLRAEHPKRAMSTLCEEIISTPAPRAFVGEERACDIIGLLRSGRKGIVRGSARRRMYGHLMQLTEQVLEANPGLSLERAVFEAVNTPAPEFFISTATAVSVVYAGLRREAREQRAEMMAKFGRPQKQLQ